MTRGRWGEGQSAENGSKEFYKGDNLSGLDRRGGNKKINSWGGKMA